MTSPQPGIWKTCPDCRAQLPGDADICWLCRRELSPAGSPGDRPPIPGEGPAAQAAGSPFAPGFSLPRAEPRARFQFGLASILLVITLCAVLLAIGRMSPGIAIVLAILATPALVRTALAASRSRARGEPMSVEAKAALFASTVGILLAVGVAAGVAFFVTCFGGFYGGAAVSSLWATGYDPIGWGFLTGVILGLIAALSVAGYLGYVLFKLSATDTRQADSPAGQGEEPASGPTRPGSDPQSPISAP